MSATEFMIADEAGLQRFAAALASQCPPTCCVLLQGDLGAGKTSFARGFIGALKDTPDEVISPSFMLVQTYAGKGGATLWHFDLYRLKSAAELREIGLEDALADGITLIEWPEVAEGELPGDALTIHIRFTEAPQSRNLKVTYTDPRWAARVAHAQQQVKENAA